MDYLVIYQCPKHQKFITLGYQDETGGGMRILGGKCCSSQYKNTIKRWPLDDRNQKCLKELITLMEDEDEDEDEDEE